MKGLNMILRKTLLFGTVAAVLIGVFATSSSAQRRTRDRGRGPPSLSLMAEPTVIRNCEGDAATVRLNANATSNSGNALRYKWTANGGRISGTGANVTWDLAGARPGVYQAVVDVDEGDPNCAAFSSVAVVVTECPPRASAAAELPDGQRNLSGLCE